jgi:hypothetical protein
MKITKRQLRQMIQESSNYEEIKRIRDSGDYSWRDMEYEVVDLMESMQTFPAQDVIDIMYDALDAEDRRDDGFWHMMLSDGGHLYEALDGLKNTADEEYDPDIPVSEGKKTKSRLLSEGAYVHDLFRQAATALEMRDGSKLEDLAREIDGLMMNEREQASFSLALNAMAEAAYELDSYEDEGY